MRLTPAAIATLNFGTVNFGRLKDEHLFADA
jgi:hypothetical protein